LSFQSVATALLLASIAAMFPACHSSPKLPEKGSKAYSDVVSAFYIGLAALQVGDDVHAESKLSELTQLVPAEPAGWANWGVLALRQRNYDVAAQRFERARDLAPQDAEEIAGARWGTLEELAGPLRERLLATGHAFWRYRVALHDAALAMLRAP